MSFPPIHRVVTGHDAEGKAVVASNGPLPTVAQIQAIPGTVFHEVWETPATPAPVDNGADPTTGALKLPPPRHGTRIRFVDIPPDSAEFLAHGAGRVKDAFAQIGDVAASTVKGDSPHPLMHRTESIDYGIVLSGEIPNPVNPPPGCRFQTRCPLVEQRCREASPPLEEKAPGHWAACWLR